MRSIDIHAIRRRGSDAEFCHGDFRFLEATDNLDVNRYEISDANFGAFRRMPHAISSLCLWRMTGLGKYHMRSGRF